MSIKSQKTYTPIRRFDRNSVGATVERFRKAQNLTRDELAARAKKNSWDVSPHVMKRIETGEREVTDIELRQLAKALRVPAAVLLE